MRLTTPPFEAVYDACLIGVEATSPSTEAMFTIDPWPLARSGSNASCDITNTDVRLTSTTRRNSSGGSVSAGPG